METITDSTGKQVNLGKLNKEADLREGQWNWMGGENRSASEIRQNGGLWIKPMDSKRHYMMLQTHEYPENPGEYLFELYTIRYEDLGEWELSEITYDGAWPSDISDIVVEEAMNGGHIPESDVVTNYWGELESKYDIYPPNGGKQ